jgi:hypothetical protein
VGGIVQSPFVLLQSLRGGADPAREPVFASREYDDPRAERLAGRLGRHLRRRAAGAAAAGEARWTYLVDATVEEMEQEAERERRIIEFRLCLLQAEPEARALVTQARSAALDPADDRAVALVTHALAWARAMPRGLANPLEPVLELAAMGAVVRNGRRDRGDGPAELVYIASATGLEAMQWDARGRLRAADEYLGSGLFLHRPARTPGAANVTGEAAPATLPAAPAGPPPRAEAGPPAAMPEAPTVRLAERPSVRPQPSITHAALAAAAGLQPRSGRPAARSGGAEPVAPIAGGRGRTPGRPAPPAPRQTPTPATTAPAAAGFAATAPARQRQVAARASLRLPDFSGVAALTRRARTVTPLRLSGKGPLATFLRGRTATLAVLGMARLRVAMPAVRAAAAPPLLDIVAGPREERFTPLPGRASPSPSPERSLRR